MDIDLRLLRSFVAMHEAGLINRAADHPVCTVTATSMRLKMRETETGPPLRLRTPKGPDQKPHDHELCAKAPGVLATHDEMLSTTRLRPKAERFRLDMPHDFALGRPGQLLSQVSLDRAEFEISCDMPPHLMAVVQRQDMDLALGNLESLQAQTRAMTKVALQWVGAPPTGSGRRAAYPEGCVFRRAMIATQQTAGRLWQAAVQSRSQAGIFAAVRAGLAGAPVAAGTSSRDRKPTAGLPALPRMPIYLGTATNLRPAAHRLKTALTARMAAWEWT